MNAYNTVLKAGCDEVVIQKSRFIGYACPCDTEEDALAFIRRIREKHRDARHHCYAYVIGQNKGIMRYSDDGEPGGTAGLPIISVMNHSDLVNCCVVVVRYFGGILLGTGGLVRAYTEGCKIALRAACACRMEWTDYTLCEVPYSAWDMVRHAAGSLPVRLEQIEFGTAVCFRLLTRTADTQTALETLQQVSGRQLEILPEDAGYENWALETE